MSCRNFVVAVACAAGSAAKRLRCSFTSRAGGAASTERPRPSVRWYRLTLGRLLAGLLAIEGFLLLSQRFQWFSFNHHKGWAVLIAVASVGVFLLLTLLWLAAALVFHWRFQFTIRSLLVLTVAVAVPCSWLATEMQQAKLVQRISELGGSVEEMEDVEPPPCLLKALGGDFFFYVGGVTAVGPRFTDAELGRLKALSYLMYLDLFDTNVTDAGATNIRQAFPKCDVTDWKTAADTLEADYISRWHIHHLLNSKRIYSRDDLVVRRARKGLATRGVRVPKRDVEAATRLLREDARKGGYWIAFGGEAYRGVDAPKLIQIRLPIAQLLSRPEFATDKPLGRFLRSPELSAKLRACPFVESLGIREREYSNREDQPGYELRIVLRRAANDHSGGREYGYQIWSVEQGVGFHASDDYP